MHDTPVSKEAVVLKLLEEGDAMLCLDARCQGVHVPRQHASNPALRLILNVNFPRPIEVTEEGISASLSFGSRRFACYIPMEALWAAFNPQTMQGRMWPESMPPEVVQDIAKQQAGTQDTVPAPAASSKQAQTPAKTSEATPPQPRQRGHLRVIK
jgi:stringent starvation protein B